MSKQLKMLVGAAMFAVLAFVGMLGVFTFSGAQPVQAQQNTTAMRSIDPERVAPGGSVTVTIQVGQASKIIETLPDGFTYTGSSIDDPADNNDVLTVGQTVTFTPIAEPSFTYTVAAPEAEDEYTFSGVAQFDTDRENDLPVGGASTIAVIAGDPLVNRYDANGNGTIEKSEVIAAINDYLFVGVISKGDVIRLINLYLFGPSTQHNRPGEPEGLTATGNGQTEINLSWTAPSDDGGADITGYRIEVSTDGSSWSNLEADTRSTGTSYSHTGLSASSTHHYRVSAINSAGTGPASDTDSATTDAATKPGEPTGLTATADGQTEIDLSWTAPTDDGGADITGYRIEFSTDGSSWSDLEANTRSTSTSYSHASLTAGSTRHYRVSAINSAGTGPASNVVTGTTDTGTTAGNADTDRAALGALYNATDGANWHDKDNWQSEAPMGEWHGVTTDSDGRVTHLDLHSNELTGEIPAELGDLSNLAKLWLSSNQLTGEIPSELGSLTNLQELGLTGNRLTGEIPSELGSLTNLLVLLVYDNQLTGEIPAELGSLTNLRWLELSFNQLTGEIPAGMGGLTNLVSLSLSSNQLTGEIPVEMGSLTNLVRLSLYGNELTGEIPVELGSLTNLGSLSLYSNELTGEIPVELGSLPNLGWLYLEENQLTGEIPAELGSLTNLEVLSLFSNELTGEISSELGSLTSLKRLELSFNELTGEIPFGVGQPDQPGTAVPTRQPVDRGDTGGGGEPDQSGTAVAPQQRVDRGDTCGVGQPDQPDDIELLRQRVDRGDTSGVGRPDQPESAGALHQPVDRRDTSGIGRPDKPGVAVSPRQPVNWVHTRRAAKHTEQ